MLNDKNTTAPVLDIKQVSTLVRVNDGDTIVIGGLIQNKTAESLRKIPLRGEISRASAISGTVMTTR